MNPPCECATTTYGPATPAACTRRWSSSASDIEVIVPLGRGSLTPVPARSYVHTRKILLRRSSGPPRPLASRATVPESRRPWERCEDGPSRNGGGERDGQHQSRDRGDRDEHRFVGGRG